MKIFILASTLESGGAERVINLLSNEFAKEGQEVKIAVSRLHHSFYAFDDRVTIDYIQDNEDGNINFFSKIIKIRKSIKKFKPDIVLVFAPHTCVMARMALVGLKTPFIISERSNPKVFPKDKKLRYLYFKSFKKASGAVYQTKQAMEFYKNFNIKNSIVIMNPVIQRNVKRNTIENVIVNTGRLGEEKNQVLLIDAFDKFAQTHNNYQLRIYGGGILDKYLKEYASTKNSKNNIEFMGQSTTWIEDSKNASMFVLTSNFEGMPNALIEAMSIGIPCISTDCPIGGPSELIKDGINGFLVPVGDVNKIYEKMCLLAENKEIADEISSMAIKINDKLNIEKVAKQWLDFIKKVLVKKKK